MSDFEYIYQQVMLAHYKGWNDTELRKCVDMLIGLTHEELFSLYTSKWLRGDKAMWEEEIKNKEVKIGGCVVSENSKRFYCYDCGYKWGSLDLYNTNDTKKK